MREDLEDAYAAIDWARAEIPSVKREIDAWIKAPPYLLIEEPHPEMGKKLFKLEINRRLPGTINAAVGAIVNSARTSLDLLAAAMAKRNGVKPGRGTHFPIYSSFDKFSAPDSAAKRKKWLSAVDLQILEELKPYPGGNDLLVILHHLDILRKHERLLKVTLMLQAIFFDPQAGREGLEFPATWPGFEDGAIIAWTNINATHCEFQIPAEVSFNETGGLILTQPVIAALRQFASMADGIIQIFERT